MIAFTRRATQNRDSSVRRMTKIRNTIAHHSSQWLKIGLIVIEQQKINSRGALHRINCSFSKAMVCPCLMVETQFSSNFMPRRRSWACELTANRGKASKIDCNLSTSRTKFPHSPRLIIATVLQINHHQPSSNSNSNRLSHLTRSHLSRAVAMSSTANKQQNPA